MRQEQVEKECKELHKELDEIREQRTALEKRQHEIYQRFGELEKYCTHPPPYGYAGFIQSSCSLCLWSDL